MVRQIRSDASQARVLQAAYELFLQQGYAATSMRQIAERANLTIGGIYGQFENKEAIWQAVFRTYHPAKNIAEVVQQAQGNTIAELLRDAAHRMVTGLGDNPDVINLTFIELVEFKGRNMGDIMLMIAPKLFEFLQKVIQGEGKLRDIPVPILARAFIGMFFSYFITEILVGKQFREFYAGEVLDPFIDIYLYGILDEQPARGNQ